MQRSFATETGSGGRPRLVRRRYVLVREAHRRQGRRVSVTAAVGQRVGIRLGRRATEPATGLRAILIEDAGAKVRAQRASKLDAVLQPARLGYPARSSGRTRTVRRDGARPGSPQDRHAACGARFTASGTRSGSPVAGGRRSASSWHHQRTRHADPSRWGRVGEPPCWSRGVDPRTTRFRPPTASTLHCGARFSLMATKCSSA